ncbi:MAG: hypothetical protein QW103_01265 [Candidatus Pacearchaeota archaeon]
MRKIETIDEKKIKEKKKKVILVLIMVLVLLISTLGYAIFSREEQRKKEIVNLNNKIFFKEGIFWVTEKDKKFLYFNYLPNETKEVFIDDLRGINYQGKRVYFVNSQPVSNFIINNIKEIELFQEGCIDENCSRERNLPIKNCSDYLIIFRESNETKVLKEGNCIFLEGDLNKAADAFMYKLLKIN